MLFRSAPFLYLIAIAVFSTAAKASTRTTTPYTSMTRRSTPHRTLITKFRAVVTDIVQPADSTPLSTVTSLASDSNVDMGNYTQSINTTAPFRPSSTRAPSTSGTSTSSSTSTIPGSLAYAPLPGLCVPGTFLCTSSRSFSQCVATSDNTRAYVNMGAVPDGMQCITHLATTSEGWQYQDDEVVRLAPLGYCRNEDGTYKCLRGGSGFAVCDGGIWVDMGAVALGTICEGAPGLATIVASN